MEHIERKFLVQNLNSQGPDSVSYIKVTQNSQAGPGLRSDGKIKSLIQLSQKSRDALLPASVSCLSWENNGNFKKPPHLHVPSRWNQHSYLIGWGCLAPKFQVLGKARWQDVPQL